MCPAGPSWAAALLLFGFGSSALGVSRELVCLTKQLICGLSRASRVETGADCRLFPAVSGIAFDRLCASSAILGIVLPCFVFLVGLWCC